MASKSKSGRRAAAFSLGTLASIFALRTVKLAYQRSHIKHLIGSVVGGDIVTVKLGPALVKELPKTSLSFGGKPSEPINLILVGSQLAIEQTFRAAGWHEAVPVGTSNWVRALWATIRGTAYPDGPITPFYIGTTPNDLAFQRQTPESNFHQRHHVRFWRSNLRTADGEVIWLGSASFDRAIRVVRGLRMPYHHIDPDLDSERDLITRHLVEHGATRLASYAITAPRTGRNAFRDRYRTDGRVVVVRLPAPRGPG